MTIGSTLGARTLLVAGLAYAGVAVGAVGAGAQEQPPQGEVLLPGPMLLGGAAVVPGASGQDDATTEQDATAAAGEHGGMDGHDGGGDGAVSPEPAAAGPADAAFQAAMDRMHQDMVAVATTGDPDVDFARAMIPHHQGAIEMAKAVIAHGKDPEIKRLAEEVVSAQEREIVQMNEWLLRQGR